MKKLGRRIKDLTGQRFGRLMAIQSTDERQQNSVIWECICDCGKTTFVPQANLTTGNTKSCGCGQLYHFKERRLSLAGRKFGLLTAIAPTENRVGNSVVWEFRCICGATVFRAAAKFQHFYSCGCLKRPHKPYKNIGEKHHCWKGGRYTMAGYILVYAPDHPYKNNHGNGYVFEHRLVMEECLGRYLTRKEVVHHIDGDRANNNPDNLMLFPGVAAHMAHHRELRRAVEPAEVK